VKTEEETKYLKYVVVGCDGLAKIVRDQFFVGVSVTCMDDKPSLIGAWSGHVTH